MVSQHLSNEHLSDLFCGKRVRECYKVTVFTQSINHNYNWIISFDFGNPSIKFMVIYPTLSPGLVKVGAGQPTIRTLFYFSDKSHTAPHTRVLPFSSLSNIIRFLVFYRYEYTLSDLPSQNHDTFVEEKGSMKKMKRSLIFLYKTVSHAPKKTLVRCPDHSSTFWLSPITHHQLSLPFPPPKCLVTLAKIEFST